MKARAYVRSFLVTCIAIFILALSIVFSLAQQEKNGDTSPDPTSAVTQEQLAARLEA
jgi:hypothetical protein